MLFRPRPIAALFLSFLIPLAASAWWERAHQEINRAVALKSSPYLPSFIHDAADQLAYLGPQADTWRKPTEAALKEAEDPNHILHLELLDGLGDLPSGRYAYYRLLYSKRAAAASDPDRFLPENVGLQPYAMMESFDRLKVAFRDYRRLKSAGKPTAPAEQDAITAAGRLGHYVADGANPLHDSIHNERWQGDNPNGYSTDGTIHAEIERYMDSHIAELQFAPLLQQPQVLSEPFRDYIRYLRDQQKLVEKVYQLDKAGAFRGSSPQANDFLRRQAANASQMLLNLWYTAWIQSASPAS